jgi:hypothetical protein
MGSWQVKIVYFSLPISKTSRCGLLRRFLQKMPQGGFKFGKLEYVTTFFKPPGRNTRAREEEGIRHLSEHQAGHRRRKREKGWPTEHFAEGFGKFEIGNRMWCNSIHRTGEFLTAEDVFYCPYQVIDRNPTPKLSPTTDSTASVQAEWCEHLLKRATFSGKHHADAKIHHPDSRHIRRFASRFPFAANLCQKIIARGSLFVQ